MNKILFTFLITSILIADNENLISILKQKQFDLEYQSNKENIEKLKKDWINRVNISYSKNWDNTFNSNSDTDRFQVSINQPIFKSGGIWYAIKYADSNNNFNKISIDKRKKSFNCKSYSNFIFY